MSKASPTLPSDSQEKTLGVAFFDLSRMAEWASHEQDGQIADFFQRYYVLVDERLEAAGGRIVKFMGDAGLVVFEPQAAEPVIAALDSLACEVRQLAGDYGISTYLNINVHVGSLIAANFGPPGKERFDVIGKTVNIAARLGRRGMTLSPQAFRCLGPETRKTFSKNMPPITYRRPTG